MPPVRALMVVVAFGVIAATLSMSATSVRAATCANYSNQAAAQQAADTRDADGDGVYCESLPCPCSTANAGTAPNQPTTERPEESTAKVKLGPSMTLAPVTQRTGCVVSGPLPDSDCTPGARFKYATKAKVCVKGYSKNVRNVSSATKNAVYAAYGMTMQFNGSTGEVDHLVSLELGGSNAKSNLLPEAASPAPGSHEKDKLENRLHSMVCAGTMTLRAAQRAIANDWVSAYKKYIVGQAFWRCSMASSRAAMESSLTKTSPSSVSLVRLDRMKRSAAAAVRIATNPIPASMTTMAMARPPSVRGV